MLIEVQTVEVGDHILIDTGGAFQPPLLPRRYEGDVVFVYPDVFYVQADEQESPVSFSFGSHLRIRKLVPSVLVKCASHRAREKMLRLVEGSESQALFSPRRDTGKGVYRIRAEYAEAAKAITGVSGFRDGDDLMECWS